MEIRTLGQKTGKNPEFRKYRYTVRIAITSKKARENPAELELLPIL